MLNNGLVKSIIQADLDQLAFQLIPIDSFLKNIASSKMRHNLWRANTMSLIRDYIPENGQLQKGLG